MGFKLIDIDITENFRAKHKIPAQFTVIRLQEIHNSHAFIRYQNQKKMVQELNGMEKVKEKMLFHGSKILG